jgi:hypothetical protein
MTMFAQLYMNGKMNEFTPPFAISTEKPVLKGFVVSIIAGTVIGGCLTAILLKDSMIVPTLINAIAAGAAVGASAGLLFFGLFDVVISGRLEEGANLVEDAERLETPAEPQPEAENAGIGEEMAEEAGIESEFPLAKAS